MATSDEEIARDPQFVVAAVTTTFPEPPPDFCVPLPWHPRGHPVTKLTRRSAVVVNWLAAIATEDVVGFGGDVPARVMQTVATKLKELQ